ncbi:MAG: NTP transferase domain-containing protein [Holophagaceae bacterium]|uniref:NTP transferase domain-containing protein n=1 Tax=Candidatus Geothrix skivensis TaxID=2954439 RepID=A0A9D7XGR8_9BACT|nr:NTP transferase domain-containing protein [Candidatus Geothrix skivensis]
MDVVVLAGGLGTRLRSVVGNLPKLLAPVDGRPFANYLLETLDRQSQVDRVIFATGRRSPS